MTRMLKLASAGVGVAALLGLMGASSFANFTANATRNGSNQGAGFQAGTVRVALYPSSKGVAITGTNPGGMSWTEAKETSNGLSASVDSAVSNMAPGDTWQREFTIKNTGTLPELYQVSVTTGGNLFGGPLGQAAQVDVWGTGANKGTTYHLVTAASDGNSGALSITSPKQWFEVDPGSTEHILVDVSLPWGAGNNYQGQSGNFTINVTAQQADNYAQNPANAGIGINYLT